MIVETTAIFEDGILRLDGDLALTPGDRVRVVVTPLVETGATESPLEELDRLCEEMPVFSEGDRLTREQLHDRR